MEFEQSAHGSQIYIMQFITRVKCIYYGVVFYIIIRSYKHLFVNNNFLLLTLLRFPF